MLQRRKGQNGVEQISCLEINGCGGWETAQYFVQKEITVTEEAVYDNVGKLLCFFHEVHKQFIEQKVGTYN